MIFKQLLDNSVMSAANDSSRELVVRDDRHT